MAPSAKSSGYCKHVVPNPELRILSDLGVAPRTDCHPRPLRHRVFIDCGLCLHPVRLLRSHLHVCVSLPSCALLCFRTCARTWSSLAAILRQMHRDSSDLRTSCHTAGSRSAPGWHIALIGARVLPAACVLFCYIGCTSTFCRQRCSPRRLPSESFLFNGMHSSFNWSPDLIAYDYSIRMWVSFCFCLPATQ